MSFPGALPGFFIQEAMLKIEHRSVAGLVPYARNARTHSDDQVAQIAASIREFGWTNPILVDGDSGIIAGHGRLMAARKIGMAEVPVIELAHLSDTQKRALILADNKLALNAGWDEEMLALEIFDLKDEGFDVDLVGFDVGELEELSDHFQGVDGLTDPDAAPEPPEEAITKPGDVWLLGKHRVMCGDSTSIDAVEALMDGKKAALIHADPPYGMGKESEGVANDNLYGKKLDDFQMAWWNVLQQFAEHNCSAYIWGNAPELWRLWYLGGLDDSGEFEFRNEIVWDKNDTRGMASAGLTQYPQASERCLFFQFGNQFRGNINAIDFPETWEPLRAYLEHEANIAAITRGDIQRVCGCSMYPRWFSRSQFTLIPEKHYKTLQAEYIGRFSRPWKELKTEWDRVKTSPTREIQNSRSYFDNSHASMYDIWDFRRVSGPERYGHPTPKPVAMMERIMLSSLPQDGICIEPFGGSGTTLIACEKTERICYGMELSPQYCDVIVKRWQDYTGKTAVLESTGQSFDEVSNGSPK